MKEEVEGEQDRGMMSLLLWGYTVLVQMLLCTHNSALQVEDFILLYIA